MDKNAGISAEPFLNRRYCFPVEIISHAVRLYHLFSLNLRDVELILAKRGVAVTCESVRHWCRKFGAEFAKRLPGRDRAIHSMYMKCLSD